MRKLISTFAAAGLLALSSGAAFASTGPGLSATVSGTSAPTITAPSDVTFSGVTLDGVNAKTATGTLDALTATDATGLGKGWTVEFSADQFSNGTHTLALGSLSMAGLTAACATGSCTGTVSGSSTQTLDNGADGAVTVAGAAADNGMGSYTLTPGQLSLTVPPNAYAGTYSSTLTITIAALP